jgi:fermentation-respiration switch protein FrsA (DUF1100 family)
MEPIWRLLATAGVFYAVSCVFARLVSPSMVFLPPPASYGERLPGLLTVPADDGTPLAAVYLPHPEARHLLMHFHGNAEDIGQLHPWLREAHAAGFAVLALDYRGYGRSGGRPSESAFYADAAALLRHARVNLGWEPRRIIVHGRSLGGAAAARLAATEEVGAVVLESAFVSAYRVMTRVPVFLGDRFRTAVDVRRARCPVWVIHGTRDEVVGAWTGPALYRLAPEPKRAWWVEGAGHNNLGAVAGAEYWRRWQEFASALP